MLQINANYLWRKAPVPVTLFVGAIANHQVDVNSLFGVAAKATTIGLAVKLRAYNDVILQESSKVSNSD